MAKEINIFLNVSKKEAKEGINDKKWYLNLLFYADK